ncbi:MAG: hypothetical protein ACMZ66_05450 [Thalassospira sp.]|uniref:hypothetical protein n=1 Tax=Thalassospira sp. TaxID=1912094 RepID=UPI003A8757D7
MSENNPMGSDEAKNDRDIVAELRAKCVGHPNAEIKWPHRLLHDAADEIIKFRKLDAEYGRVEMAILMADQWFDGDSDHGNCGDRLVASVERFQEQINTQSAEIERLRAFLTDISSPTQTTDLLWWQIKAREALKGGAA